MVLVDSSIWIEAGRSRGDLFTKVALQSLLEENEACWCGPVRLEVLGGSRAQERPKLLYFFSIVPYLVVGDDIWDKAKSMAWRLRDKGVNPPWNDVLIATIAQEKMCRVFARDKHFEQMAEVLGISLYQPNYGGGYNPF